MSRLGDVLRWLVNQGIDEQTPPTAARHIRVTNTASLLAAVGIGAWVPMAAAAGHVVSVVENSLAAVGFLVVLGLEARGRHTAAVSLALGLALFQMLWATALFGVGSASPLFFVCLVTAPYLMFHRAQRRFAQAYSFVAAACGFLSVVFMEHLPLRVQLGDPQVQTVFNTGSAMTLLFLATAAFSRIVERSEDALKAAHARSEALLLNVLPPTIARRLQARPDEGIADRFDHVAVLFADIVGFTPLSSRLPPEALVRVLDGVFTEFDALVSDLGLEKIKTIGDAYMVAGGLPTTRPDATIAVARLALRMLDVMERRAREDGEALALRIGIHTGPVVAGIIGRSRFSYDLWGDTVNIASRLESHGTPGRIHISTATRECLDDRFETEACGLVALKGKEPMETWFLNGVRG